ncbi:MAG: amidohydrolase family protein [Proteobacteria bacterium]|nr:amidohydrolase family protein [Pseudomonadota bacterium]
MPYVTSRAIHDADAHIMETPEMLADFADPELRERIGRQNFAHLMGGEGAAEMFSEVRRNHADPAYRASDEADIMCRKNWHATGSFLKEDRARALDHLGFKSQLMFNTFWNAYLLGLEMGGDLDLAYGAARAHNRAMLDFCAVDRRLLAACYVPLMDFERTAAFTAEVIKAGAKAILVPSACPAHHSPSHTGLFSLWRQAEEAGLPIVMHVGGGGQLLAPEYFDNGLPPVKDFHGGAENFRSVDYMAIPRPTAQTLATLIIDGIFEAYPKLKFGIIEQGAVWLPGLMQQLDAAHEAFARHEERLRKLSLRPSEYVKRQLRVTPYPTENTGWVINQVGEEVCLFSSDYPHVEGGRAPIKRFDASLETATPRARERFYHDNFVDLMGAGLA